MSYKNYLEELAKAFAYFEIIKNQISCNMIENKYYDILTTDLKKIKVSYSLKSQHKTIKNNKKYEYNLWELQLPEDINFDYLFFVVYETEAENSIPTILGYFVFPKELLIKIKDNKSLSIFDSDLSGNYRKEPKINKHDFFKNINIIQS